MLSYIQDINSLVSGGQALKHLKHQQNPYYLLTYKYSSIDTSVTS